MEVNGFKSVFIKYIKLTLAAFIYSVSISLILDPNSLAPGGVTGISIILNHILGLSTGTWFLLLNIPILCLGMWKFGFSFIISTVYCTGIISVFTNFLENFNAITNDLLLAAISGGALCAVALGTVLKTGSTTGGTDIIIKVLRMKYRHLKTSFLVLVFDFFVVVLAALVFRDIDRALYAALSVVIISIVLDLVLYGKDEAKLIYIISDKPQIIAGRLLGDLGIGVTFINGYGAYSGMQKEVIMCVMKKNLSPKAEEIIRTEDRDAFMIVSSATEIFGEGYKNILSEKI